MDSFRDFLLSVCRKIESLKEGVIAYGYKDVANPSNTYWVVSLSDYELYMQDKRFKTLSKAWHTAAKARGERLLFVCGWTPKEETLVKLAEEDNLVLNIM